MFMERVKKVVHKRTKEMVNQNLKDKHLQLMDYWDTPLAGYIINVCRPGRVGMECLDIIMKENMIEASSDGKQAGDYRLYRQ